MSLTIRLKLFPRIIDFFLPNILSIKSNFTTKKQWLMSNQSRTLKIKSFHLKCSNKSLEDARACVDEVLSMQAIGQVISAEANFLHVKIFQTHPKEKDFIINFKGTLLCIVRSVLKKTKCFIVVGDRVKVENIDWVTSRGVVSKVYARESLLGDPPIANIDHIIVMVSILKPRFEPLQVTRFLVEAESTKLPVTLLVNKVDIASEQEREEIYKEILSWQYVPLLVSASKDFGIDKILNKLSSHTSVVIGPSGVGKSSLINAIKAKSQKTKDNILAEDEYCNAFQAVGDVSAIGRGKHTTRAISLIKIPQGGYLADTPGFNLPNLQGVTTYSLASLFPEMSLLSKNTKCRFSNCSHMNEPGCIINNTKLSRYEFYSTLYNEIKEREDYEKNVLQIKKKIREGTIKKKFGKDGQVKTEALLEKKKHRRISRKQVNQKLQEEVIDYAKDNS